MIAIEDAWPRDAIGFFDPGMFRIGDMLCAGEELFSRACRASARYEARIMLDRLPFSHARWVVGPNFDPKTFDWEGNRQTVQDRDGLPLVLFRDDWAL